jgi:hypothetical protein
MGPMTGRRRGFCAGYDAPGFANAGPAWGYGQGWRRGGYYGRGGGRGWRHRFCATGMPGWMRYSYGPGWESPAPPTREEEIDGLRQEADWLQGQLDAISRRMEELQE